MVRMLAERYLDAVAEGDVHAHRYGCELAESVLAVRSESMSARTSASVQSALDAGERRPPQLRMRDAAG